MRSSRLLREIPGGRVVGLAAATLGLLAITALASRGSLSGKAGPATGGGLQVNASPWEYALIAAGGLIAFVCLLLYGGGSRRSTVEGSLPNLLRRLAILFTPVIAALLIAGALDGLHRHNTPLRRLGGAGGPQRPITPRPASFTVPAWVTWGIVGTFVAGVLVLVVGASARPRRSEQQELPSAAASAVSAALVDLDTIADPRLAIIAAYRRMEQFLGEAGFPRAAPEAPREYLGRVATALEIDPKPLGTLTTLFEAAKFSLRQLDAGARERAISALHALQAQLA